MTTTLSFPLNPGDKQRWGSITGCADAYAIARAMESNRRPICVVTRDSHHANRLATELEFFKTGDWSILQFPDWETLPYDMFSPHEDLISERLSTLSRLSNFRQGIILISMPTLMQRLAPRDHLQAHSFSIKIGDRIDLTAFRQQLSDNGYRVVNQVMEHGEVALRGSIIDIYPMGSEFPFRLDLLDDEVESIRLFDPETQRSTEKLPDITCLPAHEFPLTEEAIIQFRRAWRQQFTGNPTQSPLYNDVSNGIAPAGIEYYLPLFFDETATFFDYLPPQCVLIRDEHCLNAGEEFWREVKERHEQRNYDISRPILSPEQLFIPVPECFAAFKRFATVEFLTAPVDTLNIATEPPPSLPIQYRLQQPLTELLNFLDITTRPVLIVAESPGRREALRDLLQQADRRIPNCDSWDEFQRLRPPLAIAVGPLNNGLMLTDAVVLAENQLFADQITQQRGRKTRPIDPDIIVRDLSELRIGTPVVHIELGVARYCGLQKLAVDDVVSEFLTLEYAGGDKVYVPVTSLQVISRYSGSDIENAPLHRLGSDQWQKAKRKANEAIHDVAVELLDIYAKREAQTKSPCQHPDAGYKAFAATFPFEETDDQQRAIDNVIGDMTSGRPMDRLICGDVGFGKTEVAMRAAYLAVQNQRQVAILTPTTLLAGQHYENFLDRFADFPVNIALLTRFRTAKQQESTLEELGQGKIDIVIGTHKLIQKGVKFHNLGLVIIDEEHRFGVKQKEFLKALRTEVDIVSLTATPIPRTLNMAMGGIRDISLIATPPARRLSIKTFWQQSNSSIIREALLREILRGGQVFYLHNNIDTIQRVALDLTERVPEAQVRIAHGQMHERELEKVMSDFYHRRFNVLVCTTIIETGIDIPTANTIIIDRADRFGLAQLHQIRGRVGRSHHQAYAYLLTPDPKTMTADSIKRLEAITTYEDLGAGFMLATHDLEIRGAGELLGDGQSGNMQAIGYSLYMELLERAVNALKAGKTIDLQSPLRSGPEIDLSISTIIPEDYVPDVQLRLTIYKRIASCTDTESLRDIQIEMIDRFGLLPVSVKNLIRVTELQPRLAALCIKKLEGNRQRLVFEIGDNTPIAPLRIIELIQKQSETYQLTNATRLVVKKPSDSADERIGLVYHVLNLLEN